jgi:uncharacterized protein (TIGR03546 family)
MILWTLKLISTARRAIAGRKYPHQLAWAVAFGLLLGIVPHGNLLAIVLLLVVLSLKINHAMAALTAIGATFLAIRLDPFSHQVGDYVLTHPNLNEAAVTAWQLPLVPWTDLNNTVVMGSFLIGVGALIPVFAITYPVFRLFAPSPDSEAGLVGPTLTQSTDTRQAEQPTHEVVMIDQGHNQVSPPHRGRETAPHGNPTAGRPQSQANTTTNVPQGNVDFVEIEPDADSHETDNRIAVETRIDVIRMKDHRDASPDSASQEADASQEEQQPMDEALNYLLRQLRDSQERKAA